VPVGKVFGVFRMAGYPEAVAYVLTALTTNVVPRAVFRAGPRPDDPAGLAAHHRLGRRLATPHLPQGAPTSAAKCRRTGGQAQNRDGHADFRAHLAGRVAWVAHTHPERGARLRAELDRVAW
jgi:hypothetical protein